MTKRAHVRKKYWNEPTMGLWERMYLPEILRGMAITGGVFMRNMATLDDRAQGRAHDVLPRGDALGLRAATTAASTC